MAIVIRDRTTPGTQLVVNSDGSINPPALTKGTQGASGYTVQDLKDSGRVTICWTVDQLAASAASEAMLTVTQSKDGAATTTNAGYTITSGKRLRLQSMIVAYETGGTTVANLRPFYVGVRFATGGSISTSSPLIARVAACFGGAAVTAAPTILGPGTSQEYVFPDGMEFLGDGTKQIGFSAIAPGWVSTTTLPKLTMTAIAYEY